MWGKQLAHSAHSGARPPHQLSRQVSQEDKGPPPPAAAPPPTRATRCGGGAGGGQSRPGPGLLPGPRTQLGYLAGAKSHPDPPGPSVRFANPLHRRISVSPKFRGIKK